MISAALTSALTPTKSAAVAEDEAAQSVHASPVAQDRVDGGGERPGPPRAFCVDGVEVLGPAAEEQQAVRIDDQPADAVADRRVDEDPE